MNIFDLTASLTLDTSNYKKGVESAKSETKEFATNTEKNIKTIATNAWVQLAKEVVNFANKLKNATLDLINYADRYSDLSAQYDISTQSLQEFEYIASQSSTTLDQLLSTMTMMSNRAKDNADVFGKLGVSVKDTNGNMKSMDTLFWEVKEALDSVENSGDKSALMLEVFGRNAMSVGEVLRKDTKELQEMSRRANELGIIMDTKTIESASKFNDKLAELQLIGKSAFAEFIMGAEGSEEKLDKFIDKLVEYVDKLAPKISPVISKLLNILITNAAKQLPTMMETFTNSLINDIDWKSVGVNIIKAIWQGFKSSFKRMWDMSIGKGWLWGEGSWTGWGDSGNGSSSTDTGSPVSDTDIMPEGSYEVSERSSKSIEVKVTASGGTPVDEESAKTIAKELAPYIDKELGGY